MFSRSIETTLNKRQIVPPEGFVGYASVSRKIARVKKRYFEDLKDGEHLHCQPVVMTQEAIID